MQGRLTFVNSRIKIPLHPLANAINVLPQTLRIQCNLLQLFRQALQPIKRRLQIPQQLQTLIIHNRAQLLIPQHRHRVPPLVLGIRFEVDFMQILAAEEIVNGGALVPVVCAFAGREVKLPAWPAFVVAFGVGFDDTGVDAGVFVELFHLEDEVCAVGEGAEEADIEVAKDR